MQETVTRTAREIEELVANNMRLVPYIVNKLNISASWEDFDDIHQVGYIGLLKAAQTWSEDKSVKFNSYAGKCIKNEVLEYLIKYNNHQQILRSKVSSYDAPIIPEGLEETGNVLFKLIIGDEDVNYEDFSNFFNKLSEREKIILNCLVEGYTMEEIGKIFKVTRGRIQQIKFRIGLKWVRTYGPVEGYSVINNKLVKDNRRKGKY